MGNAARTQSQAAGTQCWRAVELTRWTRRAHGSQAAATRARIVLAGAEPGAANAAVARALGVCRPSVIQENNRRPKPFVWTKTAGDILAGVARFCQRTSNPDH